MLGRRTSQLALLVSALALGACSFVLDFDGLQDGNEQAAGGSGGTSSGGSGGTAGVGGGTACGVCDDKNPCTKDSCDTSGEAPTCVFEPQEMVPDGMSVTQPLDEVHNINLVSAGGKFYLSRFAREGGKDDLTLWTFGRSGDATTFQEGARFSTLRQGTPLAGFEPASGAGLLALVENLTTNIYITLAARQQANQDADVWILALDENLELITDGAGQLSTTLSKFAVPDLTRNPILWQTGNTVNVGWLTRLTALFFPLDDSMRSYSMAAATGQRLAPLDDGNGHPGMLVVTDNEVRTQIEDGTPVIVPSCITDKSLPVTGAGSVRVLGNYWYTWWSRAQGNNAVSDITTLACGAGGCLASTCGSDGRSGSPGVRNPDFAVIQREIEPSVLNILGAIPNLSTSPAELDLTLSRLRIDAGKPNPEVLASTNIPIVDEEGPPDSAKIAVSGEDKVAVAWIQRRSGGAALRVERYLMCYPDAQ
ncbi:MAG: hypothetical protein H6718_23820 [Polyangiaceae bacterium]|nr:hypothetical protein [Myxococcales bacterium]MCB9588457.1 hypothetical protein [Polyangiaceae bacterium]